MRAPRPEPRGSHYDPVTLSDGGYGGADGDHLEAALVTANSAGTGCPQQGSEGGFAGIDALDLVHVGGVDWRCQCAKEEGAGGEGG